MRDLAARMNSADQKVLLHGTNVPRVGSGSQVPIVQGGPIVQSVPIVRSTPVVQGVPIVQGPTPRAGGPAPTQNNPVVPGPGGPTSAPVGVATPQSILPAPSPQTAPTVGQPTAPAESVVTLSNVAGIAPRPQDVAAASIVPEPATEIRQPAAPALEAAPRAPSPLEGPLTTVPAGAPLPAMLVAPAGSGAGYPASSPGLGGYAPSTYPTRSVMPRGPGLVQKALISGTSGLTLWEEPRLASQTGRAGAEAPEPKVPWTLSGDLGKYRAHAVKDGSRNSGENLKRALERAGMTLGDGANVFLLGYASDRAKPFRANDGKGLLQEPGKVPQRAGVTIGSLGYAVYSILDLATLNSLPDPNKPVYEDNNPLVRPLLFTGRTIGGVWKTTEEVGNALTWGLFDNVTGCVGLVIEDIVELLKHAGEAVTNVVRVPFHLAAGHKPHEGTDRTLDWVLLVPLELVSNAVEMKGISNMEDYKTAFRDKGVIGSVLEFGGSAYIVYRAVDKLADELKDDKPRHESANQGGQQGGSTEPPPPPEPPTPPPVPDTWEINYPMDGVFSSTDFSWWDQVD